MGLSDGERKSGIYYSVKALNEILTEWNERCSKGYARNKFKNIKNLIDQTWHAMFGTTTNGIHWFTGSSSSNQICGEPNTPWQMAIVQHLEPIAAKLADKANWKSSSPPEEKPFDAMEFLNIPNLIINQDGENYPEHFVFKTYQWVEQLSYYLRRYRDEFKESFQELDEIVSKIYGECYVAFQSNKDFAKAYVIHQIMEIIYSPKYPWSDDEFDVVTKIMNDNSLHHDFGKLMAYKIPIENLVEIHIDLTVDKVSAMKLADEAGEKHKWCDNFQLLKSRCFAMLKLIEQPYQYEHIQKKIIADIEKSPLKPHLEEIKKLIAERVDFFKNDKKDEDKYNCDEYTLKQLDCYGPEGHRVLWDHKEFIENLNEAQELTKPKIVAKKKVGVQKKVITKKKPKYPVAAVAPVAALRRHALSKFAH